MFEVSSNIMYPALINCISFFLKAPQVLILCLATLAGTHRLGQVCTNWGKVVAEVLEVRELHV